MTINWQRLNDRIAAMGDAARVRLAAGLAEQLKYAAPVNPETRRARQALASGATADAALIESLETLRDGLDDEYFRLDAAEDEEAAAWFQQARAVSALVHALQGLLADAVEEAGQAVDDPQGMLEALGLGDAAG